MLPSPISKMATKQPSPRRNALALAPAHLPRSDRTQWKDDVVCNAPSGDSGEDGGKEPPKLPPLAPPRPERPYPYVG